MTAAVIAGGNSVSGGGGGGGSGSEISRIYRQIAVSNKKQDISNNKQDGGGFARIGLAPRAQPTSALSAAFVTSPSSFPSALDAISGTSHPLHSSGPQGSSSMLPSSLAPGSRNPHRGRSAFPPSSPCPALSPSPALAASPPDAALWRGEAGGRARKADKKLQKKLLKAEERKSTLNALCAQQRGDTSDMMHHFPSGAQPLSRARAAKASTGATNTANGSALGTAEVLADSQDDSDEEALGRSHVAFALGLAAATNGDF
mmetsp:Transcript_21447/g.50005  ORF Transcript_21447/g.50005 Transcript_21447/m.50005 type:complete len:259 (-) Transcript_21447:127-903(-)